MQHNVITRLGWTPYGSGSALSIASHRSGV